MNYQLFLDDFLKHNFKFFNCLIIVFINLLNEFEHIEIVDILSRIGTFKENNP